VHEILTAVAGIAIFAAGAAASWFYCIRKARHQIEKSRELFAVLEREEELRRDIYYPDTSYQDFERRRLPNVGYLNDIEDIEHALESAYKRIETLKEDAQNKKYATFALRY